MKCSRELIHFFPPRRCSLCAKLTSVARVDDVSFSPCCPTHGYLEPSEEPTRAEREAERQSILRFVLCVHGDAGKAKLIEEVEPASVPGYYPIDLDPFRIAPPLPDRAWKVAHHKEDKQWRQGYVVYRAEQFCLEWTPERRVQPETISKPCSEST